LLLLLLEGWSYCYLPIFYASVAVKVMLDEGRFPMIYYVCVSFWPPTAFFDDMITLFGFKTVAELTNFCPPFPSGTRYYYECEGMSELWALLALVL
jgi:hypothetical protein